MLATESMILADIFQPSSPREAFVKVKESHMVVGPAEEAEVTVEQPEVVVKQHDLSGSKPAKEGQRALLELNSVATADDFGLDSNATPLPEGRDASQMGSEMSFDDPPKRKRLGWGQGLARLQSKDVKAPGRFHCILIFTHSMEMPGAGVSSSLGCIGGRVVCVGTSLHSNAATCQLQILAGPVSSSAHRLLRTVSIPILLWQGSGLR